MRTRNLRVAAQLQRVLNESLRGDVKDPRLQGVSVSAVEITGDIDVARVFVNTLDPDADPQPVMTSLQRASGYLRSRVAKLLHMRHTPELRFCLDQGPKRGLALTRLIDAASQRESGANDASAGEHPLQPGREPRE